MTQFICNTLEDTQKAAEYFAQFANPGQCFALHGDLGSGKTTFTKFFISHLLPQETNISSPTFNIVHTYTGQNLEIWHADCYRLKSPDEFEELGFSEAFTYCVTIIEWPEIIENFLPQDTIHIYFTNDNNSRIIRR